MVHNYAMDHIGEVQVRNDVEVKKVAVNDVPVEALDSLRPIARRNGFADSDSATARFAIVELARRIKEAAAKAVA